MPDESVPGVPASPAEAAEAAEAAEEEGAASPRFTRHEAHPFQTSPDGAPVCALCGELRVQIRHHPTRVAAACRLRGLDPRVVLASPARSLRWAVWRQDDHGTRVEVRRGLSEAEARSLVESLEERGHRQLYWVEPESRHSSAG
jgi:hypothetical protein